MTFADHNVGSLTNYYIEEDQILSHATAYTTSHQWPYLIICLVQKDLSPPALPPLDVGKLFAAGGGP
jgi:hypothetical protein